MTYEEIPEEEALAGSSSSSSSMRTLRNFLCMAILLSANHGTTVSCLALATSQLGSLGAWQSGVLYIFYTGSSILGAPLVVKHLGARNALILAMGLYCCYVGCFWFATVLPHIKVQVALFGAALGGVGAGFLWTAQGTYFAMASKQHALQLHQETSISTSRFAGLFAFVYLAEEVALRALSTALLSVGMSWSSVFGVYTAVAVLATVGMGMVYNYPPSDDNHSDNRNDNDNASSSTPTATTSVWYKVTAALQLLKQDPKMKYLIGLNAVFGFAGSFLNSFVNGQVVPHVFGDSTYVGLLTAIMAIVAAFLSLVFGKTTPKTGKGPVLILGALCFASVAGTFVIQPNVSSILPICLVILYILHGTGRATFEGTLKATFADYFPKETEGAFANIILQNGLSSAIGYIVSIQLLCSTPSSYCVEFNDGTLHNVLGLEVLVLVSAVVAILGYGRASFLYRQEQNAVSMSLLAAEEDDTERMA